MQQRRSARAEQAAEPSRICPHSRVEDEEQEQEEEEEEEDGYHEATDGVRSVFGLLRARAAGRGLEKHQSSRRDLSKGFLLVSI